MTERKTRIIAAQQKNLQSIRFENFSSLKPEGFLDYLKTISIEQLLADRRAQAALAKIMDDNFTHNSDWRKRITEADPAEILLMNPYPEIELAREDGHGWSYEYGVFQLADGEHWYYFSSGNPGAPVPHFLRPEDVVPSGTYTPTYPEKVKSQIKKKLGINEQQFWFLEYNMDERVTSRAVLEDIPFNKPINRVPILGGEAERYNYNDAKWEPNGDGKYKPEMKEKVRGIAGKLKKRFSSSTGKGRLLNKGSNVIR